MLSLYWVYVWFTRSGQSEDLLVCWTSTHMVSTKGLTKSLQCCLFLSSRGSKHAQQGPVEVFNRVALGWQGVVRTFCVPVSKHSSLIVDNSKSLPYSLWIAVMDKEILPKSFFDPPTQCTSLQPIYERHRLTSSPFNLKQLGDRMNGRDARCVEWKVSEMVVIWGPVSRIDSQSMRPTETVATHRGPTSPRGRL